MRRKSSVGGSHQPNAEPNSEGWVEKENGKFGWDHPGPPLAFVQAFTFKVATACERDQAQSLFESVYQQDVGYVPRDELDPVAHYLIAQSNDHRVVGTFRLLGPKHRPFDIERYIDLSKHLPVGAAPALTGRLSICSDQRRVPHTLAIQIGLLRLACEFAKKNDITHLLLYTLSHLSTFYRKASFESTGVSFTFEPLKRRMHIMKLDLSKLSSSPSTAHSLTRFMAGPLPPNIRI